MGVIGGTLGYQLLRTISKTGDSTALDGSAYVSKSKLDVLLGDGFGREINDRVVVDFGCGSGSESVEMARLGAKRVIGIDIQERFLAEARERAREAGVMDRCTFATFADARLV
jgi:2-polyprenyl-3-methyl-5-hydroxy-6-metoxy-1,4-benzoquinol methylase